ncbi:HEXXH motif domain-containing protein [Herbidospora mongoliensis]|uniref:HEXXH motif domain-containing protein n=1 Tax=Herbidospora mongoliensis TaxID=688067 RepID=UPI000835E722|nr:HEXXH motif domain-containing protein [Herbidospora mongoliensis]
MNLALHHIPDTAITALARGEAGAAVVGSLRAAELSKHHLLLLAVVRESEDSGHPNAGLAAAAYARLASLDRSAPASVERVIGHPATGHRLMRTYETLRRGGKRADLDPGLLAALALAAAVDAGLPCQAELHLPPDLLMLPSVGCVLLDGLPEGNTTIRVEPTAEGCLLWLPPEERPVQVSAIDSGRWRALSRLSLPGGPDLILDDLDPCRWPSGRPVLDRLTDAQRRRWKAELTEGWRILRTTHPTVAAEFGEAISAIVPIPPGSGGLASATNVQLFGAIAMSSHADPLDAACSLTHELQHAKLNALQEVVDLARPEPGVFYRAPWRTDERPAHALLQGVYAFFGVSAFWREQSQHGPADGRARARTEYERHSHDVDRAAADLLAGEGLTDQGRRFVETIRATLADWRNQI